MSETRTSLLRLAPCLVLLVHLVCGMGSARGLVLCVGEAGHLAIESASDGCCGQPWDAPAPGSAPDAAVRAAAGSLSDCADCLDISLGGETLGRVPTGFASKLVPGDRDAVAPSPIPPFLRDVPRRPQPSGPSAEEPPGDPGFLRTVRLLL
jgi:hypothetical protein